MAAPALPSATAGRCPCQHPPRRLLQHQPAMQHQLSPSRPACPQPNSRRPGAAASHEAERQGRQPLAGFCLSPANSAAGQLLSQPPASPAAVVADSRTSHQPIAAGTHAATVLPPPPPAAAGKPSTSPGRIWRRAAAPAASHRHHLSPKPNRTHPPQHVQARRGEKSNLVVQRQAWQCCGRTKATESCRRPPSRPASGLPPPPSRADRAELTHPVFPPLPQVDPPRPVFSRSRLVWHSTVASARALGC